MQHLAWISPLRKEVSNWKYYCDANKSYYLWLFQLIPVLTQEQLPSKISLCPLTEFGAQKTNLSLLAFG